MYHLPWGLYVTDSGSPSVGEVLLLSPFPDGKTEAQRGYKSCPKTHVYKQLSISAFCVLNHLPEQSWDLNLDVGFCALQLRPLCEGGCVGCLAGLWGMWAAARALAHTD